MVTATCPHTDDLQQLLLGMLPADRAESLEIHVAACPRCESALPRIRVDDTLISVLRGSRNLQHADGELLGLIERLKSIQVPAECRTTTTDATGSEGAPSTTTSAERPPVEKEQYDFLLPAKGPSELGWFGDYCVKAVLGVGGMGVVFAGEDQKLKRTVALKVMKPSLAASASARQRFLREAQAMAATSQVEHPNLVPIHQVSEWNGLPYFTMPLLRGETLHERLKRTGQLSIETAVRIAQEVAKGLHAAHAHGLIHRDIKPGNIWLNESEGRARLLDFGLARCAEDEATQMTLEGVAAGTPAYMSPEQAAGRRAQIGPATDVYSLGVVLFQMLTGRLPFEGRDSVDIIRKVQSACLPRPSQFRSDLPKELENVVLKAMARDPKQRYADATELLAALIQANERMKSAGLSTVTKVANVSGGIERRSRRRYLPVAVVVLIIVPFGIWLAATILSVKTETGELIVHIDDNDVQVTVVQNGVVVVQQSTKRRFELKAGDGEVHIFDKETGLKLSTKRFVLTKGRKESVVVTAVELAQARKPKDPIVRDPNAEISPDRRAAEWVLSVGGKVKINGNEREILTVTDLPRAPFDLTGVNLHDAVNVDDKGLAHFTDCQNLTFLDLSSTSITSNVGDAGVAHFNNCKNLAYLNLTGSKVSDAGLAHFKDCKKLTHLYLRRTKVTNAGLAHFKDWQNLTHLDLGLTQVSDAGLAHFKDCKGITFLNLVNTLVYDAGLANFKACKNLRELILSGTKVSDAGLAYFKGCKSLEHLALEDAQISDEGLSHFKDFKHLFHVDLRSTHRGDSRISDAALAHLQNCNLTELLLNGTNVSDAGLTKLAGHTNLKSLKLSGTKVTAGGITALQKILPMCKIEP